MDRIKFFNLIRHTIFGGKLTSSQVQGMENILDYWLLRCKGWDLRWLAYMLATTYWETAHTMQPVTEYGGEKYLKGKKYWPYVGRGLVQLTWEANYAAMTTALHSLGYPEVDLVNRPEQALEWKYAIPIMVEGMTDGVTNRADFTKYGLEDFFNGFNDDPKGARRIINGMDKATEIAAIHQKFAAALLSAAS